MANNFSRSLPLTGLQITDTINSLPAWEFMNQTGTLGTNLNGSLIYVGGTAGASNVSVIPAGTVGLQNTVTGLNLQPIFTGANPSYAGFAAGSGYFEADNVATTVTSLVHKSAANQPDNLTVDINVVIPTANTLVPGTGYTVGPFTVTEAGGLSGTIDTITGGGGTGPIGTFTIIKGGFGYAAGDVLTIVDGGGTGGSITLVTAPNGAVTADITIGNNAGTNYSVGDIVTVDQAGSQKDCKFVIREVQSLEPTQANDAVIFNNVPVGSVLPIYVDYVTATGTTATLLVAGRESSIA